METTKFEIEIMTDKLIEAMHDCAYDISNDLSVMRQDAQDWNVVILSKDIAGNLVVRLFEKALPSPTSKDSCWKWV